MTRREVLAAVLILGSIGPLFCSNVVWAQTPASVVPKVINPGDILSGQLNAIRSRGKKNRSKRPTIYQLVTEPRRLPAPGGLCNLETGPVSFQIVTTSEAQAAQLKPLIGKSVAFKVQEISCAEEPGVMSEAMVTKWALVR